MRSESVRGTLSRVLAALIVAATAATLAGGATTPAAAHPGPPSAVFDPDEVAWASVRDMTPADFQVRFDEYAAAGYLVVDLDLDVADDGRRIGAAFQRNLDGRGWLVRTRLTKAEFDTEFVKAADDGMRLVDFETYVEGSARYYAAAWVRNVEGYGWSMKYNLTAAEFTAYYTEQRRTRMPVDVDIYPTGAGTRYALVWVDNAENLDWRLLGGITRTEYQDAVDAYQIVYRSLVVDSALTTVDQRYAGIWVENTNHRRWWVRSDLTRQEYVNWWHRYADEGYRVINFERYETAKGTRYAGVWRQNSDRPGWKLRRSVDNLVQAEANSLNMPGIAVAVIQDGEFRYLRGFGHANVDDDVWLDSGHVLRIASVSKGVGGVLTMRAVEDGQIDPADVAQWQAEDTDLGTTWYANATAAAAEFWDSDLVCPVGDGHYSTHGYTVLGAALEGATGTPVAELTESELTASFNLGTLRPEDLSDTSVRRSTFYDGANDEYGGDEVSWKVLGGGMESSVADLARFADKLIGAEIVGPDSLDAMWVDTGWSYAYGWSISTEDGHRRIGKNGGANGSTAYLQMYPDDGIVVAVLMNRADGVSGENRAEALGSEIGTLVLNTLP
ncbi:CubicO group peptidase (beta-lactamase class C family) [Micromonospora sp. Llam0]|uniref:serine hydrolase n=1 Tax=Micromonospora sp. Llam0 TaxID=2485143 RepID=UPI000F4858D6|nr:serine hydrolase [Micromonospora sp. Llam0]ROO60763.1 CubicO group peptidase (beta-lactamase class C family) [Micromonospora sp. Llam0]